MRPDRFRDFAIQTYTAAGLEAEAWQETARRPNGIKVTLPSAAQIWHAITAQSTDGDDLSQPEKPVEGQAPEPVPVPDISGGTVGVTDAERHLAALVHNANSREVAAAYAYSARQTPSVHPGYGVNFHSGARVFCVFVHALRPGQSPAGEYDLPREV